MGNDSNDDHIVPIEPPAANLHAHHETNPSASDTASQPPLGEGSSPHQPNHPDQTSHNDITIWQLTLLIFSSVIVVPLLLIASILAFLIGVLNFLLLGIHSRLIYVLIRGCTILPEKYRFHLIGEPIEKVKSLKNLTDVIHTRSKIVRFIVRIRLMMWSLLLLLIALTVPALKHITFLGLLLWQWPLVFLSVCLGNRMLKWAAYFVVKVIYFLYGKNPTLEYWAKGLKQSVAHIVFFLILLVMWIRYFQSHLDLQDQVSRLIVKYVTWAFVSFVIGAVLWLVKSILLLSWTAHAIYHHFKGRIIKVGRQLYFMVLISEPWLDIYRSKGSSDKNEDPTRKKTEVTKRDEGTQEQIGTRDNEAGKIQEMRDSATTHNKEINRVKHQRTKDAGPKKTEETKTGNTQKKKRNEDVIKLTKLMKDARNIVIRNSNDIEEVIRGTSVRDVKVMARFFMFLSEISPREDDHLLERVDYEDLFSNNECILQEDLQKKLENKYEEIYKKKEEETEKGSKRRILSEVKAKKKHEKIRDKKREIEDILSDVNLLFEDLKQKDGKVDAELFKKYMNNAYKNSLALGRTLSNAKEVMKYLDIIMSVFLVILVILCWLLLSDLATTRVLVALASPFLAATFIFGDTCKRIFEGVIFSFVTHPFDVGDLCVIDNTELVVKRISISGTTFLKIGGKEEVLYPTSVLATKSIVNFKGDPDMNDQVELCFDINATNLDLIKSLEKEIPQFLKDKNTYESHEVEIKEVGSKIKIAIHFKHCLGSEDVFHAQCLQKKNRQKNQFMIKIREVLEDKYQPSKCLRRSTVSEDICHPCKCLRRSNSSPS